MTVVSGVNAKIRLISSTTSQVLTNPEPCTTSGDDIHWHITAAAHRLLDPTTPFTVQVKRSGSFVTETTGFKILYGGGVVKFDTAQADVTGVQFTGTSGKYFPYTDWGNATGWKLSVQPKIDEVTALGDTWVERASGIVDATCSITGWWTDDFLGLTNMGSFVGLVLYEDTTSKARYEAIARIQQNSPNVSHDAVEDVSVDLLVEGEPNYATYSD
jgi:uncharacterized protein YbjQ (UPF0145 family)